jgi:hypothetical protein
MELRPQERKLVLGGEGQLAAHALVEEAGERVEIGALVERLTPDLLGGGVSGRAQEGALLRQAGAEAAGEPEVAEIGVLRVAGTGEEHVSRLYVAVQKPCLVRGLESLRKLRAETHGTLGGKTAFAAERVGERGALDQAHGKEERPGRFSGLVDGEHMRVVQGSSELRLTQETVAEPLLGRKIRADQLQRDPPLERELRRAVDDAHPATSDRGVDAEAGEEGARGELSRSRHGAKDRAPGWKVQAVALLCSRPRRSQWRYHARRRSPHARTAGCSPPSVRAQRSVDQFIRSEY